MSDAHNYAIQRSYKYESHDKDGNANGLTREDWKKKVIEEWTCDRLKANHIIFIFHDKDTDDDGNIKELHAHGVVNFENAIPVSNAIKLTGCSSEQNCSQIRGKKSQAYRYLLHITERAIKEKKHIYDEDSLFYSIKKDKICDYKKLIRPSEDEESDRDDKKLLDVVIAQIRAGVYGDGGFNDNIYEKLLLDEEINRIISKKIVYKKAILNAIEVKSETYFALLHKEREEADKNG